MIPSRQLTLWYFALAGALRSVCERGAFRPVADESANHRTTRTRSPAHGQHNGSTQNHGCRNSLRLLQRVRCFRPSHFRFGVNNPSSLYQEGEPYSYATIRSAFSAKAFLAKASRRRFSEHAFQPQPKTLLKFSSSLRRPAREHLCKGTVSTVPIKRTWNALPIAQLSCASIHL